MRSALIGFGLVVAQATAALAAPQIKQAECGALEAWGAHVNNENDNVAPRVALPKAFDDAQVVPLFGVGVLAWTQDDLQAANQLLTKCFGEAQKRRDGAAANALANANRALQGLVPRANAVLQKAKADAEPLKQQIAGLPDSPELDRGLAALLKINPAQPDLNVFRPLPHEVADPLARLAGQVLPVLANADREALFKTLGERHAAIQASLASAAEKTIAAAPPDADGMIQLIATASRIALIDDADTRTRLQQSAGQRLKQIGDALRQAKPAVWVAPSCSELYRWSGANNYNAGVALGGRTIFAAFVDERVVPVFGLSLADWSDQDVARFKALRGLCQSTWQALAANPANNGANAPELLQLAQRGRWIDGADQQIADARAALTVNARARQGLAAALDKIRALPDTNEAIPSLKQIAADPMQNQLSPDDHARFVNALNGKVAAISAHASDAAMKGLADVKVDTIDDLKKLFAYKNQTMPTILDPRGRQMFEDAFMRRLQEATPPLLADFKKKLEAAPATLARVAEANIELLQAELALRPVGTPPEVQTYVNVVEQVRDLVAASARRQACADYVASLGAEGDAGAPLWDGHDGTTLGEFLCAIGEHGTVNSYSGAGWISSTSTLKVTPFKSQMFTVSLHKAEVKAGKPMLVGFEVRDSSGSSGPQNGPTPNGPINIEGWEIFVPNLIGLNGSEPEECMKIIDNPTPDKLEPPAKVLWLHCWTLSEVRLHVAKLRAPQR